ncbi:MAG TPA: hypothetical protein VHK91_11455 [Flavisolibacter sp.]|jgi:hypothetical protein|nr:hypothetical protein [Flavisolibacter sp.]
MNRVFIFIFLLAALAFPGKVRACPENGHQSWFVSVDRSVKAAPIVWDASDLSRNKEILNAAEDEDDEEEGCVKRRISLFRDLLVFSRALTLPVASVASLSLYLPSRNDPSDAWRYLVNRVIRI